MLYWTLAVVVFIIIEAATTQFVSIWFAGGAVAGLITSLLTENIMIQLLVFVIISAILLILTKSFVRKLKSVAVLKTNADALIGQTAVVVTDISNIDGRGNVKLRDIIWSARSADGSKILSGAHVKIIEINGVKLIVENIEDE